MFICVSSKLELGWVKLGRSSKFKKHPEVHRTMHRTLSWCVRCGEYAGLHSPDAGTVSLQRPVRCVRCSPACPRAPDAKASVRWPSSGGLPISKPLCVLVRWSPDASGATLGASDDPESGAYNPCPRGFSADGFFLPAFSPTPPVP